MARLRGNNHDNVINGTSGNDTIEGRGGHDILFGGGGHDQILGGDGHDNLYGGAGDDLMNGGSGNDRIYADGGADVMTGGLGADTFVLSAATGNIIITDFTDGVDRIDISAFGFDQNGYSPNWAGYLIADGANTIIDFYGINGEHFTVTLLNVAHTSIDITDYVL